MVLELEEKQFELGGVVFGLDCPVHITDDGWTPGSPSTVTNDTQLPGSDGIRMGKDFAGTATWSFKMFSNGTDEEDGWAAVSELAGVWGGDDHRKISGAVVPLRYRVADQRRRIYGRPGLFTPTPNNLSMTGRVDIAANFRTVDHLIYEDQWNEHVVTVASPEPEEAGFVPPIIPPIEVNANSADRQDSITIGGSVATPVVLTFTGPLAPGAKLVTSLWTAQIVDRVRQDDPVILDARPWVRSATLRSGGAARVSPRITRVSKLWLPPGQHNLIFTGGDNGGTASVTVGWHNAYRSPR